MSPRFLPTSPASIGASPGAGEDGGEGVEGGGDGGGGDGGGDGGGGDGGGDGGRPDTSSAQQRTASSIVLAEHWYSALLPPRAARW